MSGILTPGDRPDAWQTIGDLQRRIQRLEALNPFADCACIPFGNSYEDVVGRITVDYAWYKLPETGTDDWADSSGGGRTLTHTSRTNEVRGVTGIVQEDDGVLGVFVSDGPGSANPAAYVGSRLLDSFFRFAGTASFTVIAWVKPNFFTPGGVFSYGICGNVNNAAAAGAATAGWGLYLEPTTNRAFMRRRSLAGAETDTKTVTQLLEDEWYMVAGTYDGTDMKIWLNGEVEDTDASSQSLDATAGDCFFIGAVGIAEGVGGTWAPWNGDMDSILVAAGDLSDLIPDLYAVGPTAFIQDHYVYTSIGGELGWFPPMIEVEY